MANITWLGASYTDVPWVTLPKTGGGTAQFDDTTISSDAAASGDIANGKKAFVNGSLITGTSSGGGGGGAVTQDANGYLVLSDQGGGSSIQVDSPSVTQNGTYTAQAGHAYSPVTVNVSGGGSDDLKKLVENSITSVVVPSGTTIIRDYAFARCTSMTSITLPSSITSIGTYSFWECTGLSSVSCDGQITTLGSAAFIGASSYNMQLEEALFPNLNLTSLTTAFGSTTTSNACQFLQTLDIGYVQSVSTYGCLANLRSLENLVLRYDGGVVPIASNSASYSTIAGFNSTKCTIYVPSSLVASYKTASQWSTYYNSGYIEFLAIEGSEYEL